MADTKDDDVEIDEAALTRAEQKWKQETGVPVTPMALPDDFMMPDADEAASDADGVIYMLLHARNCLGHPTHDASARETIRRMLAALHRIDIDAKGVRQAAIGRVLDDVHAAPFVGLPLETKTDVAAMMLRAALAGMTVGRGVLRQAVELWPTRQRDRRTTAVRALAKALDCDAPTIMQILRNAKTSRAERRRERRGKE
jgi:hypothetical protein